MNFANGTPPMKIFPVKYLGWLCSNISNLPIGKLSLYFQIHRDHYHRYHLLLEFTINNKVKPLIKEEIQADGFTKFLGFCRFLHKIFRILQIFTQSQNYLFLKLQDCIVLLLISTKRTA